MTRLFTGWLAFIAWLPVAIAEPADPPVAFDREVKPLLVKHCASCHGASKQKGGLRLDLKADALAGGDTGPAIQPGQAAASPLIKRVTSTGKDAMPPKGERLTSSEVATLTAWINQGAKWPDDGSQKANPADWWSLKPLRPLKESAKPGTIDALIQAKLREQALTPSPRADRRTLIRRLAFDLVGLPPTPEEIDAFVNDPSPNAYEKLVDRLLASPHYGERWARHWLDIVHFGESHGYDKDKPRPNAWPYRDYVIRSLNADKPYTRFVQEQIAGDVLFPGTRDGIEALGFLAAGPWDFIGHAEVPESKIDGKVARHLDRDDMVANTIGTFMGLTAHCAQCHNHKFDPISQEDYYRLQAVFAAVDRADREYDRDPAVAKKRADLLAKKHTAESTLEAIEATARKQAGARLTEIEAQIAAAKKPVSERPEYGYHSALTVKNSDRKWVQVDLGSRMKLERVVIHPCKDDFNNIGAGFGFPVRFQVELADDPNCDPSQILASYTASDFANPGLTAVVVEVGGKSGRYLRVTATKLSPRLPNDYMMALSELEAFDPNGNNVARGKSVTALDTIEAPVRWQRSNLTDGIYPTSKVSAAELAKLVATRETLMTNSLDATAIATRATAIANRDTAVRELGKLPARERVYVATVHTGTGTFTGTGASGGKPRPIYLLSRGDVTRPGKEVRPGAITTIPGVNGRFELPANQRESDRRAALARWITDPQNPLTWRVMANRVWQFHFGHGLVDTPNDFGKMGQLPTHPELLDFLAADLRDHQSIKRLHKLIVLSEAYQRSSASNEANARIDGDNRYLWRQNRRKLEAEAIRDSILMVSGQLDLSMGGPSFQDFVIEKPEHSPHYQYHLFDPEDPKAHRRAVYRFVVRSKSQPFMAALDCADPSLAVEKRNQTLTPQQALAMLNNKLAVAMAAHFAERVTKLATDDAGRITQAFRLALGRDPRPEERADLIQYVQQYGLSNGCRVILNLNEFVFVD